MAEVVRSGLVESRHHGSVVAVDADGSVVLQAGDVDVPMYPRSANKPAQAVAMARLGLPLEGELLALAAASHSGERFHRHGALDILGKAGLEESALQNTPGWPGDTASMLAMARQGEHESALAADCSGKHAAMLLTCVVNGWSTADYLDSAHPLQTAIRATVAELAGEPVSHTGVDGCGAPLFALTLTGLARMYQTLATAPSGSPERRVVDAIRMHPEFVSGTSRDEAKLIRSVPGLFCKGGAEAVLAAGLPDGRAVAVKIDDGGARARMVALVAALERLGVDASVPAELATVPVRGGGAVVGEVRAARSW